MVSSHHLTFQRDGPRYLVRDEGSTNGTEFDGEYVEPKVWREVSDGTLLRIVDVRIEVDFADGDDVGRFTLAETGTMARRMLGDALDPQDRELAYFEVLQGSNRGDRFALPDELEHGTMGSDSDCDVRVPGRDVASRAAKLRFEGRGFVIEPSGETDVWVDDQRLTNARRLADGDRVAFDGRELAFHDPLESRLLELEDIEEPADSASGREARSEASASGLSSEVGNSSGPISGGGRQVEASNSDRGESALADSIAIDDGTASEEAVSRGARESGPDWNLTELALLTMTIVFLALATIILAVTFGLL